MYQLEKKERFDCLVFLLDEMTVEEKILTSVIRLMKKDGPDNLKMSAQYFQFFINYSSQGRYEVCRTLFSTEFYVVLRS